MNSRMSSKIVKTRDLHLHERKVGIAIIKRILAVTTTVAINDVS